MHDDARHDVNAVAVYREFAPAPALRGVVRSYFTFGPNGPYEDAGERKLMREVIFKRAEWFCAPVFAAAHASIVVERGLQCRTGDGWSVGPAPRARVVGPLRTVGGPAGTVRPAMVGAYLETSSASGLFGAAATEFTDRVFDLDDVWATGGLANDLTSTLEQACDGTSVDRLESLLLTRAGRTRPLTTSIDMCGLTRWVRTHSARMTVEELAQLAGVSRQHLTRVFRSRIGVSPKRYIRLARFHAGLAFAGVGAGVQWAQVAADLGYADQSHMIGEFRELGGVTPQELAMSGAFHPFIVKPKRETIQIF